jgi:hypothetical protein
LPGRRSLPAYLIAIPDLYIDAKYRFQTRHHGAYRVVVDSSLWLNSILLPLPSALHQRMSHGGDTQHPDTVIADMEESGVPHDSDAVPLPQPEEPNTALTEDVGHLDRVWSLKRQRTASLGEQGVYLSLPASPKAFHATTFTAQSDTTFTAQSDATDIASALEASFFAAADVNADFESLTATVDTTERTQRAHSQPSMFEDATESETGPPHKKRRLLQHEHLFDISGNEEHTLDDIVSGLEQSLEQTEGMDQQDAQPDTPPTHHLEEHHDDDITAQLMASLQQAAEETEFPHIDATDFPPAETTEFPPSETTPFPPTESTELPQVETTELPKQPTEPETQPSEPHLEATVLPEPEAPASSPSDITLASAAAKAQSPSAIVIDPALQRPVSNPVIRTSHPLSAAPVPVIIGKPSNSRPVPTNPLNGLSRSSSAALTSRSPSAPGPRPVIPSPYNPVSRPAAPKKPSRDFTPARPTDKRRPTPRRTGGRGVITDPYQPPTASSLGYQPPRNSNTVDETNLAAGLSSETLAVLEAAAATLSQIQGPVTQEHLEGIVCE